MLFVLFAAARTLQVACEGPDVGAAVVAVVEVPQLSSVDQWVLLPSLPFPLFAG